MILYIAANFRCFTRHWPFGISPGGLFSCLHFFYDAQNRPAVVVYNGTAYAYVKNLQGDVIAILDSTGAVVVSYTYDAWGMPTSIGGTLAGTLGEINPFRYRGYVYDPETGLYYLRSRYYSCADTRFLNSDTMLGKRNLFSHNTYSYCLNNAIALHDPDGNEATWNVFVVHVRQAYTPMYNQENKVIEMVTYDTGPIYTRGTGRVSHDKISVYYFDSDGAVHTGYMQDKDVVVWYGMSPSMMERYSAEYFEDFFEDKSAKINFLRRDNSFYRRNAALDVMLMKFLETRDSRDSTNIYVNNYYDYSTEWAVREFQAHVGITVDGIVGKETIDHLMEHFISIHHHYVPE